jgi:hypothetical protein
MLEASKEGDLWWFVGPPVESGSFLADLATELETKGEDQ